MGRLIDRSQWERGLPERHRRLVAALDEHLAGQTYSLEHGEWFDDGRSGSPVARVLRWGPDVSHRILKVCSSPAQAQRLWDAWSARGAFGGRHLARVERGTVPLGGGACAVFMEVGGGDIESFRQVSSLREEGRSTIDYGTIVRSVLAEWNEDRPRTEARSVRSLVGGVVRHRRGRVMRWIGAARDLRSLVPVSFLAGEAGRALVLESLVGNAHGDLSARNILVPTTPTVRCEEFQLIDYDHFSPDAPLARDPMHLLVALALDDFDHLRRDRADLIRAVVDPHEEGLSRHVEDFRRVSAEIHEACATSFSRSAGVGGHWHQQCLLALIGVGLVHVGRDLRTADPEEARRWCYDLAVAAAERFGARYGKSVRRRPPVTGPERPADGVTRPPIIDRFFEREALTDRLAHGPHGVLSVEGDHGAGKSKLVDVVLGDLVARGGPRPPRVHRHHATPDRSLDLRSLVELIGGGPAPARSAEGNSALVRLEAVLERLGGDPVVVAVESAENLLDPSTGRLRDPELDEAFALLGTEPGHRVAVILETRYRAVLPGARSWPDDAIPVPSLPLDGFLTLLRGMDPRGVLELERLTRAQQRKLWRRAGGNPRIAELVCATVGEASVTTLAALLPDLDRHRHGVAAYLTERLLGGMHPVWRDVMHALAAFRTPVPTEAVEALLTPAWDRDQVRQSLKNLAGVRLVRAEAGPRATPARQDQLYFLPSADAAIVLELIGEADRFPLLLKVANTLAQHRVAEPRTVEDLRYHLAELRALLDRRSYGGAHDLLRAIDQKYLRVWNSSRLLLRQRHELRRNLGDPRLERANENAIGGICTDLGDLVAARAAYDRALRLTGRTELAELARLHVNIGVMHWAANDIESARESFQQAEREADEADDLIARIGALGGLADCHRRRGEFKEAIARAAKGFALSRTEAFDALAEARTEGTRLAVALAVKLSRWQAELGATEQAEKWLVHARRAAERDPERAERYQAVLEDQLADLQLAKGLGNGKVKRAVATAREAARLAQQMHDSTVLLQARTTLCVAYLRAGRTAEAAAEIARAARYRPPGRHLVVPALLALTVRLTGDRDEARRRFGELLAEADRRIARDAPPGDDLGPGDFGARRWQGFARCGLALDGRCEVAAAVASFRMIDIPNPPRPPGLVARMRFLLECLDASGDRPGLLGPAIDALG